MDRYAYTNKIADIGPGIKVAVCILAILIAMSSGNWLINAGIFIVMAVSTLACGIPLSFYSKVLAIPFGFMLMGFFGIVLNISADNILAWSVRLGPHYYGFTQESVADGVLTISRSAAALSGTIFLALTTSADSIMRVALRYHVPKVLLEVSVLIYRSIFIFLEEAIVIYRAQELRHGYESFRVARISWAMLLKELFKRVFSRYDAMVISLECRNYNGQFKMGD
ncbi:cobalt ECF transporter T component CbiQ [Gudongella sp. SC589]|jgi:cobalt/nickel transport system permease protein|uniref:cobalt ECF transporter T component CbiQ n=1 Tax=Gudongella sp. SC589 TaxID=3385990 RepID=UPI003904766E